MQFYLIIVIIASCVMFLLFCPLFLKLKVCVKAFENVGSFSIFLFGFKIKTFNFKFIEKGIEITYKAFFKQKFFDIEKFKFFGNFFCLMFFLTKIFSLKTKFVFGCDEAKQTALVCGHFFVLMNFFENFLHTKKHTKTKTQIKPDFEDAKLDFFAQTSLCLCSASFLISFLIAKQKVVKNGQ